jgi:nucleoside-diphosphate-sugar epimerase
MMSPLGRGASPARKVTMKVLVLGGSVFVGAHAVRALLRRGHSVTLLNRGRTPDDHGDRVRRIRADRRVPGALERALAGERFDAAVDVTAYTEADTRAMVQALSGRVGHVVHVSTGQVYLVRRDCPMPSCESDFDGPVISAPASPEDRREWEYGIGKRACEDVLVASAADGGLHATLLRIPIVHGEGDPRHRLTSYLARLADGGPVFLADGGRALVRHVDVLDVAEAIAHVIETGAAKGEAVNLAWAETITLRDLLEELSRLSGLRSPLVSIPRAVLADAGLLPWASPLGSPWSSLLDSSKATTQHGLRTRPWRETLARIHEAFRAGTLPSTPGLEQRAKEIALAQSLGA